MKYMGSKRYMLRNGLGELIRRQARNFKRIVDPFCGSAAVACFAAEQTNKPVLASDLQKYSVILAKAVVSRTQRLDPFQLSESWLRIAQSRYQKSKWWVKAIALEDEKDIKTLVKKSRELCRNISNIGPVWNAYGGYYFSPRQALVFDYLIDSLPSSEPARSVCLASIISAASECAAAPGHTAQPFQPTSSAKRFLWAAWKKDAAAVCSQIVIEIATRHANRKGEARVADAVDLVKELRETDLVILDPPYSGVQYSRFYHVLETIAQGSCGPVEGEGRYPTKEKRPQSAFSIITQSKRALEELLSTLGESGASAIFTFPTKECSNGLSGEFVQQLASRYFKIEERKIHGHFSTLGGNNLGRAYRQESEELLLLLRPK